MHEVWPSPSAVGLLLNVTQSLLSEESWRGAHQFTSNFSANQLHELFGQTTYNRDGVCLLLGAD